MRGIRRSGKSILNREVLVLNDNFQPLMVCTARRAICLVYLQKVDVLEKYRDVVHSPTTAMHIPSVVRVSRYVHLNGSEIVLSRKNVLKRDHHECQYCGQRSVPMTIDHVLPKERGGKDSWDNLVCCCHACNRRKGSRTPEEWGTGLSRRPRKPSRIRYIQQLVKKEQASWRPYLYMEEE